MMERLVPFIGGDGLELNKGDRALSFGSEWIIASHPHGMSIYDSYHPDSDYMVVYAKPIDDKSDTWNYTWVCRKTKSFTKIN